MAWSPGAQSVYLQSFAGRSSGSINCIAGIQALLIPAVAADDTLLRVSTMVSLNGGITQVHLHGLNRRSGGGINLPAAQRLCYRSLAGPGTEPLPVFVIRIPTNLLFNGSYFGISDQLGRGARRLVERIKTSASRLCDRVKRLLLD